VLGCKNIFQFIHRRARMLILGTSHTASGNKNRNMISENQPLKEHTRKWNKK